VAIAEHFRWPPWQLDLLTPSQLRAACHRIDDVNAEAKKAEREAKRG
jgi:hypothetical protein